MKITLKINETVSAPDVSSHLLKQCLATIASGFISFSCGLTVGISAVLMPQLRDDKSIQYNASDDSWMASFSVLSSIPGALGSGSLMDSYGRKAAHIILGVPFIIGWICIACAYSTTTILVGRLLTGLSSGANKSVTLVYIGEIASPKFRTVALILPELMQTAGILFSHIIGHYFAWKISAIICILPAVISVIAFVFLKESPLWLIAKGRTDEGIDTFRWFRGTNDASELELKTVIERQTDKSKMNVRETLKIIRKMYFLKPLFILTVIMLNVQLSGVNVIAFYSQDIFEGAFNAKVNSFTLTIVMDCIRGIVSLGICLLGKFVPRRVTFLTSNFGTSIFVLGVIVYFLISFESFIWVPVSCVVMYMCFTSAIGTVGWTFVPEVLPTNARGFGSGLISAISYIFLFILLLTTPAIINSYGVPTLFGFYGVSTLICGIILCFILPETNGKTLQAIEDTYNKNNVEINTL